MARGDTVIQEVVEAEAPPPPAEIPWTTILLLGGLLLVGALAFKKRKE